MNAPVVRTSFDRLADLLTLVAASASLEEIVALAADEFGALGFGDVWVGHVDDATGDLVRVGERTAADGRDPAPLLRATQGAKQLRLVNVRDPSSLIGVEGYLLDRGQDLSPPREIVERFLGHPFLYRLLIGSRGDTVGAIGLGCYLGGEVIPTYLVEEGLVAALIGQLGVAMERALYLERLDRLERELDDAEGILLREPHLRTVGQIAGAVAHDLNNLAGIALMALNVAAEGGEHTAQLVARAERATKAIGDLSRRLQRMARSGEIAGASATDLKQVVEDVAVLIRPLCKEHSIRLDLDLVDLGEDALVHGNPTVLRRAVMDVVLNAREAVLERVPEERVIEIRVERRSNELCLLINDSGPGIAPGMRDRLFKPMVTSKPGHSGLGLAAVLSSMKQAGGRVEASNGVDGGASFRLTFLLSGLARPVSARAMNDARRPLRILVVDDEPEFVSGIRDLLRGGGHDVASAADATNAFTLAARETFDLVMVDLGLPKRSGLDILTSLRGQGVKSKMVLMTGWDSDAVRTDERSVYCDRILQKPFQQKELEKLVRELFPA